MFARMYGWDYDIFLKQPYWLLQELEVIISEGMKLENYLDPQEMSMMKILFRSRGIVNSDELEE